MHRHLLLPALLVALCVTVPAVGSAEDQPGVFKIPGTDSTIKFYGYVQMDMTLDLGARPGDIENNDWATLLPAVPADGTIDEKHKKPQLYMTARTTRFGIQTSTPTAAGPVGVRVEGDFNAPNSFQTETFTNSVIFRLRHGYGTFGGLLVGQTWSTFLDFGGAPETVDFNGPGTLALVRNPMIRYTWDFGGGTTLAVAAENARGSQFATVTKFQTLPDFHANLGLSGKWGSLSVRGVTQYFREAIVRGGALSDEDPASKFTVGGAVSAGLKLGGDTLNLQYGGGPGIGRYMLNALGTGASGAGAYTVVLNTPGNATLELWTVHGGHVGFTHVWNPAFRSSVVGAAMFTVNPNIGGVPADNTAQKQWLQAFVNTFYSFAKNAEFGIEFAWGQWKSFSTATSPELQGNQYRVNSSFHYNFF
jgi:hypothetical protein